MGCGVAGVLIGVGPGAALHQPGRAGAGGAASDGDGGLAPRPRDMHHKKKTGKYIPIITDGGMSKGGDVCKALACGSDAVMVGSAFARAKEAPGKGNHWGMATPQREPPARAPAIKVGVSGSLKQIFVRPRLGG